MLILNNQNSPKLYSYHSSLNTAAVNIHIILRQKRYSVEVQIFQSFNVNNWIVSFKYKTQVDSFILTWVDRPKSWEMTAP